MYNPVLFKDRLQAGQKLGQKLKELKIKNPLVLAIPSGGVPVGKEVATILKAPLSLVIARKIQFPWTTEAGFGAVAADGTLYLGPAAENLPEEIIEEQTEIALNEVKYRQKEFLKTTKRINLKNKTVILVDDGLASGATMLVAVRSVKKQKPAKIIVAVPTTSWSAFQLIKEELGNGGDIISLYVHPRNLPFAVAFSYQEWHDLSDEEVKEYLKR